MNQFLNSLSKTTLALLAIGVGLLLILLNDPPRTLCDAQVEKFDEEMGKLLAPKSGQSESEYLSLLSQCRYSNGPGGCYEFFQQGRNLLGALKRVSSECTAEVGAKPEVRSSLFQTLDLMIRLAWGDQAPNGSYEKLGWFDYADINLFCQFKDLSFVFYGKSAWEALQEKLMGDLPGASNLPREQVWRAMISSTNCLSYQ